MTKSTKPKKSKWDLTVSYIASRLHYSNGKLYWKTTKFPEKVGKVAGCINMEGYWRIRLKGFHFSRSQLVWLLHYKSPPSGVIDHINGNSIDDRIENLRECTLAQNSANTKLSSRNTSGYKGVSWCSGRKKFVAQIKVNKKTINLGRYDCPVKAHERYMDAARKHFGEFACNGRRS